MRRGPGATQRASLPEAGNLLSQLGRRGSLSPRLVRKVLARAKDGMPPAAIHPLAQQLWRSGSTRARQLAVVLLGGSEKSLNASTWRLVEPWLDDLRSASLTDALAAKVLAPIVARDRSHLVEVVGWARSSQVWRRRAALETLHHVSLLRRAFIPETLVLARLLVRDPEPAVQESLGRALHRCARLAPSTVRQFLLLHRQQISELVRRETARGIPTATL